MNPPIYKPSGRAAEYCEYAINPFLNCTHGCIYCYAPRVLHKTREQFHMPAPPRNGLIYALKKQLAQEDYSGKLIQLGFLCDPYPYDLDTTITREIIKTLKAAGAHVQILTKGGFRACDDFDLLDNGDKFGVTITGADDWIEANEPNAALFHERSYSLLTAHNMGISTWVSFEPVYFPSIVFDFIKGCNYIDLFKIGKLNYIPSDINWVEFGRECERLCQLHGRNYYLKEDLRVYMK